MNPALLAACLWVVAGSVAGMLPARDGHWRAARMLMLTGAPILAWVAATAGPLAAAGFALAAGSLLRHPLMLGMRRLFAQVGLRPRQVASSPSDRRDLRHTRP